MTTSSLPPASSITSINYPNQAEWATVTLDPSASSCATVGYVNSSISISKTYDTAFNVQPTEPATLEVKGRIKMQGEYLDERLERIETLLQIPTRDVTIEAQYPKLKALYEEYIAELEKYKTWNRLTKGSEK